MNKQEILMHYTEQEDKYWIAQILDKIDFSKTKNRIVHTDFMDFHKSSITIECMKKIQYPHMLYGGYEEARRKMLFLLSDELQKEWVIEKNEQWIQLLRITLPKQLNNQYEHRNYLSALMKLGIKREKCGDILVSPEGADIFIEKEITQFVLQGLKQLKRFEKAEINLIKNKELKLVEQKIEEIKIIVPSERLDSIVSELARTSRNQANAIIRDARVFINDVEELKNSKMLKLGDIITIRGKGKFKFEEILGESSKGKKILKILKYV